MAPRIGAPLLLFTTLGSQAVVAQDPLSQILDSSFAPGSRLEAFPLPRTADWQWRIVGSKVLGVRSFRSGVKTSEYVGEGLTLLHRSISSRPFSVGASFDRFRGSYTGGSSTGRFRGGADQRVLSYEVPLGPSWDLRLAAEERLNRFRLVSNTLGAGVPALGTDPDILNRDHVVRAGVEVGWRNDDSQARLLIAARSTAASLAGEQPATQGRLTLPASARGHELRLHLGHRIANGQTVELYGARTKSDGEGDVRLSSKTIGRGGAWQEGSAWGTAFRRDLTSGGSMLLHYENSASNGRLRGTIPRAADLGFSAPGAAALYRADVRARRTELGITWDLPQGHRRRLTASYRHVRVPLSAIAGYDVRVLLFGSGETASLLYPSNEIGILHLGYLFPARSLDGLVEVSQGIPYRLGNVRSNPSGGRSITRTEGGWSLRLGFGRRF